MHFTANVRAERPIDANLTCVDTHTSGKLEPVVGTDAVPELAAEGSPPCAVRG